MRIGVAHFLLLSSLFPFAACNCSDPPVEGCMSDAECKEGERCAPPTAGAPAGRCVANPECVGDDECTDEDPRKRCDIESGAFKCVFREGFADDCDVTRPCPFGQFCSDLLGRCFDSASSANCTRRSQCPTGQICDRNANKCIPDLGCFGEQFCEDGEICDLVDHICRSISVECTSCLLTGSCEGAGESCTVDTKECLAGNAMPACRTGEKCDPLGRCVQCVNSSECGPGLFCNAALGRCESNVQCANDPGDCPESMDVTCIMCTLPEVCEPITRKCTAPPTPCQTDVECPGDQFCDVMMDPPICQPKIPDCLDDLLDEPPNDSFQTAHELLPSTTTFEELKLCPGDTDWYRIVVTPGTFLTIDARFRHAQGDLDLQLFLDDGVTVVDDSRSTNDNERVQLEAGTDLMLLLRVFYAVPQINPTDYKLVVTRDPTAPVCADDMNEPDDGPGSAKPLSTDVPYSGRLCSADPDWFVLPGVPPSTAIKVALEFTDNLGDLDLELYRAGQTFPLLASRGTVDNELIDYDASYAGDYYVRVVGKASDTNVYTIRVELRDNPESACLDDRFEPNNLPSTSTSAESFIGVPQFDTTLCAGDEDWYALGLGPGEAMTAEIGFFPGVDLELSLFEDVPNLDPRTSPLLFSRGTSPREFFGYRTFVAQDLLLRVYGHDQHQASPYDLRINRLPPIVACTEDQYDLQMRGDDMISAVDLPLPPTRADDISICTGDEDWFRVFLRAGFNNVIRLQYLGSDAQLDMAIIDTNGNTLVQTGGFADVKEIAANVTGTGIAIAFIRVFSSNGGEASYNLTMDLIPIFNCVNDIAEPNEFLNQASQVASSTISPIDLRGMTLCPSKRNLSGFGDEDWFVLNPPQIGSRIEASIDFPQSDLFMELIGPTGGLRACFNFGPDRCYSDGLDLTESIAFTSSVAGPYYLRVGSIYSSPAFPPQSRPPNSDTPYNLLINYVGP